MEQEYSRKLGIKLNKENFSGREHMAKECLTFLTCDLGYDDNIYKMIIEFINTLDSNFSFELINTNYLRLTCKREIFPGLKRLNRLYMCKDYHEMIDLLDNLVDCRDLESSSLTEGVDKRVIDLLKVYHLIVEDIFNCPGIFSNRVHYGVLIYIAEAMLLEAWINGEENYDEIRNQVNGLFDNNFREFLELRGFIKPEVTYVNRKGSTVTVTPFGRRVSQGCWTTYREKGTDRLYYKEYDYVYQMVKENYMQNKIV